MIAQLLFEHSYRGDVWRLEVGDYNGRTFGNWRKWFWQGEELKPTRIGVTIPLDRLPALYEALGAFLGADISHE